MPWPMPMVHLQVQAKTRQAAVGQALEPRGRRTFPLEDHAYIPTIGLSTISRQYTHHFAWHQTLAHRGVSADLCSIEGAFRQSSRQEGCAERDARSRWASHHCRSLRTG
jgi:hypothetical protein